MSPLVVSDAEQPSVVVDDAFIELQTAVLKVLPRDILDNEKLLIAARSHKLEYFIGKAIYDTLRHEYEVARDANYPKLGSVFELTIDGEIDPLEMLVSGEFDPSEWRFIGAFLAGKQTCRFKLVDVGRSDNISEVREKLTKHGSIPEGQWREAFKAAYPEPDGRGPIGIADISWVPPIGKATFPYINADGYCSFRWPVGYLLPEHWRWLVKVRE